ncbi:sigma-70 family RNA polymerase sigma factor [Corticibacter populi]|uniref:Sigma-70 family RNA polymerase sigma factor n=1 Tax=Corticibacter populi TaxID=1550736 RepID=A0A3M6QTR2_9BURK|nr:sigma-70 family RNA polymerase sigma factor [Corticibacter populi]RMX06425.1 sigma-70 family RNA polymerase sigma factor [Corticibacter populi]RZS32027.1 RNA polymerase sigma-70 factor (ECF subfamily) [Corticibacter populi]
MSSLIAAEPDIESIYQHHHRWLVALLNKKAGNRFDACELAHDVFVQLLRKPRQFDSFDGTRNYLSRMAHGLCTDMQRRRALEQAWQQAVALRPPEMVPSPEQRAIILETLADVAAMLERLPAKAARAFVLVHVEGLRYGQVAGELKVSERMVKKYIAQAMLHCALMRGELLAALPG